MREVGPFEDRKEASVSRKKSTGKLRAGMGYTACRGLLENPPLSDAKLQFRVTSMARVLLGSSSMAVQQATLF